MKFPYSICDFYKLITNDFFYVDRTNRIPLIEKAVILNWDFSSIDPTGEPRETKNRA